jgi:hypothetical protein
VDWDWAGQKGEVNSASRKSSSLESTVRRVTVLLSSLGFAVRGLHLACSASQHHQHRERPQLPKIVPCDCAVPHCTLHIGPGVGRWCWFPGWFVVYVLLCQSALFQGHIGIGEVQMAGLWPVYCELHRHRHRHRRYARERAALSWLLVPWLLGLLRPPGSITREISQAGKRAFC